MNERVSRKLSEPGTRLEGRSLDWINGGVVANNETRAAASSVMLPRRVSYADRPRSGSDNSGDFLACRTDSPVIISTTSIPLPITPGTLG